ncbi:hypothetical protein IJ541_03265 [bacterium]|nr:hypothetical protein [bacterium]
MKKRYFFIILSIILTIAYFDLVDTFKYIDKILSNTVQAEQYIKNSN